MKDPFVTEVRKHRMEHAKKFNFDIHAICNDLKKYQRELYAISDIDENNKFTAKQPPAESGGFKSSAESTDTG